jgi:hypothetical protein
MMEKSVCVRDDAPLVADVQDDQLHEVAAFIGTPMARA